MDRINGKLQADGPGATAGKSRQIGWGATELILHGNGRHVKRDSRAVHAMIDQALWREEKHATAAAQHAKQAAKHRSIRMALERMIPSEVTP